MKRIDCDVLVIGSGPGGAMTACLAAEAGRDVLVLEEGAHHPIDSAPSFSLAEMDQKYRNAGLNVTFGGTSITYLEGRCVGGGSEINAALYHRPLEKTLREWQTQTRIRGFEPEQLWPHFEAVERDCNVNLVPGGNGPACDLLKRGAGSMGWSTREIARFWSYPAEAPQTGLLTGRQSMTVTLIPRAMRAGARLMPNTRVVKLLREGKRVLGAVAETTEGGARHERIELRAKSVFVCAGAVQTPRLLRRAGFTHNVGDTLQLHPMIRITARFKEPFNDLAWGVPTEQVDQFKPGLTLGCSYSSIPHLALWMGAELGDKKQRLRDWRRTGIFYVAAVGTGKGKIRDLPLVGEPFIRLPLTQADLDRLGEGLLRLGQLLFAAGAEELSSPVEGGPGIRSANDLEALCKALPQGKMPVSTIHLFSSAPMGEDEATTATDSFGKLRGVENLYVNDASLFPASPAVNPQGTVLAIARRNVGEFLG
ncbi:putative GMC-type oxidoreductase y4nJ [Deltaproteobacteria bacterium]|nr:putative GMC-type oxidoreductase y4nJ [Deltaproteobacteria bacterium]